MLKKDKYWFSNYIKSKFGFILLNLSLLLSPTTKIIADSTDLFNLRPITINNEFYNTEIDSSIRIWQTTKFLNPTELVESILNSKIEIATLSTSQGFSVFYYWVGFSIKNTSNKVKKLYLEIANPQIDTIAFYEHTTRTKTWKQTGYGGSAIPFYQRPIINRQFIFPIELNRNEKKTFLLMINKRNTSVSFPLKIWNKRVYLTHEAKKNLYFHLYFGALICISVLTLIIGLSLKNRVLISYSVYVALMGIFIFVSLGFSYQFINPDMPILNSQIRFPFSVILLIAFMEFSNSFIGTKQLSNRIFKLFYFIYAISIVNLIIWIVFHEWTLNFPGLTVSIQYLIILLSFSIITYILIRFYKRNKQKTINYGLAMLALITGFIIHLFIEYGYLEATNLTMPPIMLGSSIELLIFSLAIIIEIRKINDKKNELILLVAQNQKKILKAFIKGSEQEGKKISSELHDNIGSRLALLRNKITDKNQDEKILENDVKSIYDDVRKLSHDLSPGSIHLAGFKPTIEQYLFDFEISSGIKTEFFCNRVPNLDENTSLQLFRVIQESIQNCLKHSKASKINIQIIGYGHELILTIDDNGQGFNMDKFSTGQGNGINNMKTRIASVNGEFELSTTPGKGTFIVISIPL